MWYDKYMNLQPPFNTFRIEKRAGEYKDFGLPPESTYPLKGVTYPVDYGDIEGYIAEDEANLDLFVGSGEYSGYLRVMRPELKEGEHKFYLNLTAEEEKSVINEFSPVIIDHGRYNSVLELTEAIEPFRQPSK